MMTGIIGGGLSGVALQHFLKSDSEILEKENRPGGLCRTFKKNGFLYDIGGHILFSKEQTLLKIIRNILGSNINYARRNNKILYKDRYIKYPFENGLSDLDKEEILDCLFGYLNNHHNPPSNFKQWLYYTFGDGIADKYLVAYNKKIWKTTLEDMAIEWVKRIPKPPLADILKSAIGIETEGYLHQLYFHYPHQGGIEGLIKAFINDNAEISTDFEVTKIKKQRDKWLISNGANEKIYSRLVLTTPLTKAVDLLDNVPEKVSQAAKALRCNSVRIVFIGIDNESLMDKSAVYISTPDILAHRVCFMGYFSRNNTPAGRSSLIAEITSNPSCKHHTTSDDVLTEIITEQLENCGMINRQHIIASDVFNAEFGYVVYDNNYQQNVTIVRDYFKSIGIELLGRFGQFEYINMDEVIRRSFVLASKLDSNSREN